MSQSLRRWDMLSRISQTTTQIQLRIIRINYEYALEDCIKDWTKRRWLKSRSPSVAPWLSCLLLPCIARSTYATVCNTSMTRKGRHNCRPGCHCKQVSNNNYQDRLRYLWSMTAQFTAPQNHRACLILCQQQPDIITMIYFTLLYHTLQKHTFGYPTQRCK